MDVFALREKVVSDYRHYIESFVRINDERIAGYVEEQFESGALWPDAILQLNPAYELGSTLDDLAANGTVLQATADFFRGQGGKPLQLYRHQQEALETARRKESYIVTTGTGSGKSLTYLIPIVDHVLRTSPEKHKVRAIIVYPMNALINSQHRALETYAANNPGIPVRFAQYTGQEKQESRDRIIETPPHILLTNYVMLEYMMLRPTERVFTNAATANLEFLVMDELHTYRGRQGADVAMLMRRLRERSGNPKLINIGTSATVASGGKRDDRRRAAAEVATKLFGTQIPSENIVDETLRRAIQVFATEDSAALKGLIQSPTPESLPAFVQSPLAAWAENAFGLDEEDGRLIRRKPITFHEGVKQLATQSGLEEPVCDAKLTQLLATGNKLRNEMGEPPDHLPVHQLFNLIRQVVVGQGMHMLLPSSGKSLIATWKRAQNRFELPSQTSKANGKNARAGVGDPEFDALLLSLHRWPPLSRVLRVGSMKLLRHASTVVQPCELQPSTPCVPQVSVTVRGEDFEGNPFNVRLTLKDPSIVLTRIELTNESNSQFGSVPCTKEDEHVYVASIEPYMMGAWFRGGTPIQISTRVRVNLRIFILIEDHEVYRSMAVVLYSYQQPTPKGSNAAWKIEGDV